MGLAMSRCCCCIRRRSELTSPERGLSLSLSTAVQIERADDVVAASPSSQSHNDEEDDACRLEVIEEHQQPPDLEQEEGDLTESQEPGADDQRENQDMAAVFESHAWREEIEELAPERPSDPLSVAIEGQSELERSLLQRIISLNLEESNWEVQSDRSGLVVSKITRDGGMPGQEKPLTMWNIRQTLNNCTPRQVFETLMDHKNQNQWHRYLTAAALENQSHGADLLRTHFKGVGPIACREVLEFRAASKNLDADDLWIAYSSHGTENLGIPVQQPFTRAFTEVSGYRLREGEETRTVSISFITQNDPGGSLPAWVIKVGGPRGALDFVVDLQKALDKL